MTDDLFFHFFFIEIEILEAKVNFWRGTHMTQGTRGQDPVWYP
jgi:hypothetical protein